MARKNQTQCFYLDDETFKAIDYIKSKNISVSQEVRAAIQKKAAEMGFVSFNAKPEGDVG
jgi:hypothetical protein